MHQVEMFKSSNIEDLQEQVNHFLSEKRKHTIKDIKHHSSHNGSSMIYTAMVIYV